jgi:hypothetical protein
MLITYNTDTDSISSPGLSDAQARALQAKLSTALARNTPVRSVAETIMAAVTSAAAESGEDHEPYDI